MEWYQKSLKECFEELQTSDQGISHEEAQKRILKYGQNELVEKKKISPFMMFLNQFKDFMIIILIFAAVISGYVGDMTDTLAIIVVIMVNAVIGFVQEYRAEKAMEALKKMATPTATVIRDGIHENIPAFQLVPGDAVILEAGKIVPADLRLTLSAQLKVEEAALTGESVPVEKQTEALKKEGLSLGDRTNMAYKGTFITYGRGNGIVVATGMETQLGKIATMLQGEEDVKTPLQIRLAKFGQGLAFVILGICAVLFFIGLQRGEPPMLMLLTAIALAVAAIPEALPAVVTISLAVGAKKLVLENALTRRLSAVETLGSVTFICSDKTGTLTLNKMTAEEVYFDNQVVKIPDLKIAPDNYLFTALALNNDIQIDPSGGAIGDPTEIALYNLAENNGFKKKELEEKFPRIGEIPFDSERKCMTTFHKTDGGVISFTKGAIDVLLEHSDNILSSNKIEALDKAKLLEINERMSSEGLRVLCVAYRKWENTGIDVNNKNNEKNLTILGFVGMIDPPRDEAKEAVHLCKTAGIKPVMITGDHPLTAKAIATRLGIITSPEDEVLTGSELERLSLEEFEKKVEHIRVYARVAPEQKLKIVRALQDKGQYVAMTGDGVNDAPALKRAEIGVAMGITGTDVSKEAADMILLDDNFATIIKSVKEGRKIYNNIRKIIKYLLTTNSGEIWTIFLAPILGMPIPLLPIHILWINLVTDSLPALALSVEPAEGDIMNTPPRPPKESLFAHGVGIHAVWVGLFIGTLLLMIQSHGYKTGHPNWQTMVFTALCFSRLSHVLAIRSDRESLFSLGLFSNKYLLGAIVLIFGLQMATMYVPFLNPILKTAPLTLEELGLAAGLASLVFFAVEIEKFIKRRLS